MPSLLRGFAESVRHHPTRPALYLEGESWTYEALAQRAAAVREAIEAIAPTDNPLAGVFAAESLTAYEGILGILAAGRGYVPIHPEFPPPRIHDVVRRSGIDVLIVGKEALESLDPLLNQSEKPLAVISPEFDDLRLWAQRHRRHRFLSASAMDTLSPSFELAPVSESDLAYLLFTSGSTGRPKGVPIRHGNAGAYVDYMCHAYGIGPQDRVSQTFKLAFDLSVHDLFTTWSRGACLYPLPKRVRMAPGRFIRQHELTRWFSVPTLAMTMDRFRQLAPGAFPSLRVSLFCGEALPASVADKWAQAAPNSSIHNLYGPTEATIAFTSYRWDGSAESTPCKNGVVPLGKPFPGQQTLILGDDGAPAPPDQPGELLLSGTQVTTGYWKAPELTNERFITLEETGDTVWYRTGDVAVQDHQGCLHFLGRRDDQIQVQGHRVELAEVDHALRQACGHDLAISVAWPNDPDQVARIVGFVASDGPVDDDQMLQRCRQMLPDYMVPSRIVALKTLPRNTSGKISRTKLQAILAHQEV